MNALRRLTSFCLWAVALAAAAPAWAQQVAQTPHVGYVYPAGGQQGGTFEVTVGGQFLTGVSEAHISGKGVRVSIGGYHRPLNAGEANRISMRINEARDKLQQQRTNLPPGQKLPPITQEMILAEAKVTAQEKANLEEFRKRQSDPKRQPNVQIAEEVTLEVRIAPEARLGDRELRLVTPAGMSNPLNFFVGQYPEIRETEPNDRTPDSTVLEALPAVINGQITPGDVDRFAFKARKGTNLVAIGAARELIPYLADAVPGWFQAVLALYDDQGNELAFANSFGFRQDPVLYCEIPQDGTYVIEIHDALYRGREDFVYRITLGEVPFVTSIFPLGGRAGTQTVIGLKGWNLPGDRQKVDCYYDRAYPIRQITARLPDGTLSNRVPFAVDMIPEMFEQEPNDTLAKAQEVTLPIIVNGRIERPGDIDVFRFDGQAKDTVVAEVYARRLNSPVDSLLKILDAKGKVLAVNDDYDDKGAALSTHHADSRIVLELPESGTYYVRLSDAQHQGGPEYAYRLHIRPPRPDFELRVVPSSVIARAGTLVPITVYALRRDGFADDIALDLENAPAEFKLQGAWIPGNAEKNRLTMLVPSTATSEPLSLQLEGHAQNRGRRLSHLAVPAEAMTQAFAYQHLVPAKDWTVAVTGKPPGKPAVQLGKQERIKIVSGGVGSLRATVQGRPTAEIRFELSEPPEGIAVKSLAADGEGVTIVLSAEAAKCKPGLKGNLILNALWEQTTPGKDDKPATTRRNFLNLLPAVPFEVVEK